MAFLPTLLGTIRPLRPDSLSLIMGMIMMHSDRMGTGPLQVERIIDLEVLHGFIEPLYATKLASADEHCQQAALAGKTVTRKFSFMKLFMGKHVKCLFLTISLLNISPTKLPTWPSASPNQKLITYYSPEDSQLLDFCLYYLLNSLESSAHLLPSRGSG